ncbi:phytanoyl-CoA dioxygenase family protein [Lewinella sp. LCG006]|uniref:phytanoyl-CoA dioxygenase family protein n=1 Tax=Lewinella sp. LCG006 TaxID=3231911 RepID=UPI00346105E6
MKILIEDQLDDQLLENGYVIVPFLEMTQVEHLRTLFESLHPDPVQGFYASAHVPDPGFRNHISDELRKIIGPLVEQHFTDGLALGGTFIAKAAGDDGVLQPHQDWNIVDEEQHRSFNTWIPLVDVAKENGAVEILPGSHRKLPTFRGANLPNAFDEVRPLVWSAMEVLEMKAGQALIYDHRLVHGSGPNQSEALRLAVVFGVIHRQAPMRYYYQQDGKINEYACSPAFYLEGNPGAGPADLELLRQLEVQTPVLDAPTFRSSFLGEVPKRNWWSQLRSFLSWTFDESP